MRHNDRSLLRCLATFGLWGDNPIYTVGALKQLELYNKWSAEGPYQWTCIFFVGDSTPRSVTDDLIRGGAWVYLMRGSPEDQTSTFWRFAAFHTFFGDFDAIFSRDVDSRLSEREKLAVSEFLTSQQTFHTIRDHPFHGVPVLAGLFGVKRPLRSLIEEHLPIEPTEDFWKEVNQFWKMDKWHSNDTYQVDQLWLRLRVYPYVRNDILAHDDFFGIDRRRFRSFLPPREYGDFIGKGFDENDEPRYPEHDVLLSTWPSRSLRE